MVAVAHDRGETAKEKCMACIHSEFRPGSLCHPYELFRCGEGIFGLPKKSEKKPGTYWYWVNALTPINSEITPLILSCEYFQAREEAR